MLKRGGLRLLDGSSFTFASGGRQTKELPVPSTFIKRLYGWLRGTLTISAVTVPGTVHADGPANLINLLEVLVDGYPVKVGSGPSFLRVAQLYDFTDGVNNGLLSAGAGVYNFEALIPLIFEQPLSVSPFDTILDGTKIRNLVMNVTWGTTASLVYGNTSTLALTNTTFQVYVDETMPFPLTGAPWLFRETEKTFTGIVTNTGTNLLLSFNQGSVYRAVQLRAIDGSDLSDAVINTINLRVNGGQEIPWNTIEDDFAQAYAIHHFGGRAVMPDGYYHLELSEGGRVLSTGLGAGVKPNEINSLDLVLDTTVGAGATSIVAHMLELQPPRAT